MAETQKKEIIEKAGFKCAKCNYYSPLGKDLKIINNLVLCSICTTFAPEDPDQLLRYVNEKIEWQNLDSFRKFNTNRSSHQVHKNGMIRAAKDGRLMTRPPFGYKVINGNLIADEENRENVRLIFQEFSNGRSLNQISRQYGISVNGIKKILKNFTYLGKIKFAGNIVQGNHSPLISSELFNQAQQKFDKKHRTSDKA